MLQWSMALACWSAFNVVCVQVLCHDVMRSCTEPRAVDKQTLCLLCRLLAPHAANERLPAHHRRTAGVAQTPLRRGLCAPLRVIC